MRRERLIRTLIAYPQQVPGKHDEGVWNTRYLKRYLEQRSLDLGSGGDTWHAFLQTPNAEVYLEKVGSSVEQVETAMDDGDWEYVEKVGMQIESLLSEHDKTKVLDWFSRYDPASMPTWSTMSDPSPVRRNVWLIHFSDDAFRIQSKGFALGREQAENLALTNHMGAAKYPGYNFAFIADSRYAANAARTNKYGKEAVMFRALGVKAYHYGDEEEQVMFWGPSVDRSGIVYLYRDENDEWAVGEHGDSGRPIYRGSFDNVVAWVENNFDQYRRVLI